MKKYEFSLEPLLKNYKFKEENLMLKVAEKEKCYQTEKSRLLELEKKIIQSMRELDEEKMKSPKMEIIKLYEPFIEGMKEDVKIKNIILISLKEELNNIREQLIKIIKDRKKLERLKEKRWNEYKLEQNRIELKLIDETAQIQFSRKITGA
ncbi:flagellar FliJ family protein [Candidatus Desantisbacteria bacterium]|nr:flagellar FliJ family protein [Candidatus Desantisbacteria bacterium]